MPRKEASGFGIRPVPGRADPPERCTRSAWIRRLAADGKTTPEIIAITGATYDHIRSALAHPGRQGRKPPRCAGCGRPTRRYKRGVYLHIGANTLTDECEAALHTIRLVPTEAAAAAMGAA